MTKISNEVDVAWEKLCHGCGKCCHIKYDIFIFYIADPEYACEYLTADKRCEIYEKRLTTQGCNCISLKEAVTKTGLLPIDCGYITLNPAHKPMIFPESVEEFWEYIYLAEMIVKRIKGNENVDLVSFIEERRSKNMPLKSIDRTGGFNRFFLIFLFFG